MINDRVGQVYFNLFVGAILLIARVSYTLPTYFWRPQPLVQRKLLSLNAAKQQQKDNCGFPTCRKQCSSMKNENLNLLASDLLNLDNPMIFYN